MGKFGSNKESDTKDQLNFEKNFSQYNEGYCN